MKTSLSYIIGSVIIASPAYSKIPSFVGDLVARDLIGIGPIGHVGIASAPDYRMRPTVVLEALDSVPHIQENMLFYDFISFENPDYLTGVLIKQAKKEKGEARHKLLVTLQSIYQNSLKQGKETDLKEIVNYFKELQLQDLDKNDGGIVYRGLATLAPKHLHVKKAKLTNMDKIHVNVLRLKSDRANEIKYVRDIIHNLDNPDDSLVVTAGYQYLTQLLMDTSLKFFSQESKLLFKKHLDNKSVVDHKQSILYTSAYLEFKAALNASKSEEIPVLANEYIQLLNPEIQQSTFNGFTDFTKGTKHFNLN